MFSNDFHACRRSKVGAEASGEHCRPGAPTNICSKLSKLNKEEFYLQCEDTENGAVSDDSEVRAQPETQRGLSVVMRQTSARIGDERELD